MNRIQKSFATLASFAIASQVYGCNIPDQEVVYEEPKNPEWKRKKCKSCKSFTMCGVKPLNNACELYQKSKK